MGGHKEKAGVQNGEGQEVKDRDSSTPKQLEYKSWQRSPP